ncbi:unnamed protein product [Cercospora beticola]|nr:unnamed protein product [Cercospora beticola]
MGVGQYARKVIHTVILDFHFNDCDGKQLFDFQFKRGFPVVDCSIDFTSTGATSEGLNVTPQFNAEQRAFFNILKSLARATAKQKLHSDLCTSQLAAENLATFYKVMDRLPGGCGPLLPSIGRPEFSNFPENPEDLTKILDLMQGANPWPMTPLRSGDSFSSIAHARAELLTTHIVSCHEHQQELELFARCQNHQVAVFHTHGFVVLAMKFDPAMKTLGGTGEDQHLRLPKEMEIEILIDGPWRQDTELDEYERDVAIRAYHDTTRMGLPKHDAFFVVISHDYALFRGRLQDPDAAVIRYYRVEKLRPHKECFLYESLLDATEKVCSKPYAEWHLILKNQLHKDLEEIDFVASLDVPKRTIEKAEEWLEKCNNWNESQWKALKDMRRARGRLQLISGPAGTGKSTVHAAQAMFFVKLGGRALCTTTANANADHQVRQLRPFAEKCGMKDVRIHRLYPSSRGFKIKDFTREQAFYKRAGHQGGNVTSLQELIFKKMCQKVDAFDMSVEKGVLDEANNGIFRYDTSVTSDKKELVNVWEEMRIYMRKVEAGSVNWRDSKERERFERVYEACKGHLIGVTKILLTTNGNVRGKEMVHFAEAEEMYGEKAICSPVAEKTTCFGIFVDKAAKEIEPAIWNTIITSPGRPKKPDLVVFYGDEKQLGPINTCSNKDVQYNQYYDRLSMSLMGRLLRQGFPSSPLTIQHRLHESIAGFVSRVFYDNTVINAPSTRRDLEKVEPGLRKIIHRIVASTFTNEAKRKQYRKTATEHQARLHWCEMPRGKIEKDKRSLAIPKHISLFMRKIFPKLQEHFGKRTSKEVMLIAGYTHALNTYEEEFRKHQKSEKEAGRIKDKSWYPPVLTIDAAQGQEAMVVTIDGCLQSADHLGFMVDSGRANVAMTRAQEVLLIIGGSMKYKDESDRPDPVPAFVQLHDELAAKGQVHRFGAPDDRY